MILALVSDLVFRSKIRLAAEAIGEKVQFLKTVPEQISARMILFDLNDKSGDVITAIRQARQSWPDVPRICYGAHVETDLFAEAEEAGATLVMPRSEFVQNLPEILRT